MTNEQEAVLFDLDGVLIDTEGQYTQFWAEIGKRDFPHIPDFATRIKGNTLSLIFQQYYPDGAEAQQRITDEINAFEKQMDYPFVEGAVDFVLELRKEGVKTAVVTSSNRQKMTNLYARHPHFKDLFTEIFTAENATRSKPAPDCYVNAAHTLGVDCASCYVFEDSLSGLRAGLDSGATVVALTTSNSPEAVKPLCERAISNFTEINLAQLRALK